MKRFILLTLLLFVVSAPLAAAQNNSQYNDFFAALTFLQKNDFKSARILLSKYVLDNPNAANAKFILYKLPVLEKKYNTFSALHAKNRRLPLSFQLQARKMESFALKLMNNKNYPAALDVFTKIEKSFENYDNMDKIKLNEVVCLINMEKYTKAAKNLEQYKEIAGLTEDYIFYSGYIYELQQKYSLAKVDYLKLLSSSRYSSLAEKRIKNIALK